MKMNHKWTTAMCIGVGLMWAGSASGAITSLDDNFDGPAAGLIDPLLWNTRDSDSGAGVVDFGGDAQPGTNGRGVVELDGAGSVSLEGDLFAFPAWGELGFVSTDSVLRPGPADSPLYLYFWNARSDQYRSKVFLGLSNRPNSTSLGILREGYGWSIQGGQADVAIENVEYSGNLVGIPPNQFYPVNPLPDEGGPDPANNVPHDFRIVLTANDTQLQYKDIYSDIWLSPDWTLFGGAPASNNVSEMWIVVGGRVGDPAEIDNTDFLIDRIQLTASDFNCQDGGACPIPPVDLVGDLDQDGFVGITDLNIVLGNWNQAVPPGDPLADPSGDGFVGIEDLNTVLGNWNAGTPPPPGAAVPEPATLALLGLGALAVSSRRRRA
jgi:PEP-CTERM motif